MTKMIVPQIVDAIVTQLTAVCITAVTNVNDPTRAHIVKAGRFQADRVSENIHIAVSGGDSDDPEFKDGIVSLGDMPQISMYAPPREIGGGQCWWRRGTIQIGCYFIIDQFSEADAMDYAYTVLSRVQSSLEDINVSVLVDDTGERAIKVFSFADTFYESGGPPSSYIWRGKVFWSCLTWRP